MVIVENKYLYNSEAEMWMRPDSHDEAIWQEQEHYAPLGIHADCIVIDMGAHIGCFARYALQQGARQVLCFEPDIENYYLLVQNVAGYDNVLTYHAAINDARAYNRRKRAIYYQTDGNSGMSSLCPSPIGVCYPPNKTNILTTFEALLAAKDTPVTHIKIDIEGSEYDLNWHTIYSSNIAFMVVEWHFNNPAWREVAIEQHRDIVLDFETVNVPDFTHETQTLAFYRRTK